MSLEDLRIDKLLGKGRFATVYKGYWHGDVAVKTYHLHSEINRNQPNLLAKGPSLAANNMGVTNAASPNKKWDSVAASRRASTTLHDTDIIMKDIKTLCKARHNNIVLFMAACRDPRTPAIITRSTSILWLKAFNVVGLSLCHKTFLKFFWRSLFAWLIA